jgi:hypothetical protein
LGSGANAQEAWRTDVSEFAKSVVEIAKKAKVPTEKELLSDLRQKVVISSAGTPIWVMDIVAPAGEVYTELTKQFTGKVRWKGEVESVSPSVTQAKWVHVRFPVPKDLPKGVAFEDTVALTLPETAKLPKKGDTFSFTGELKKKDAGDIQTPVWVMYGVGPNAGQMQFGVALIAVEPAEGATATPSQLLARFTHSDFLKTPMDMVFIPADHQRQLKDWEKNVAEGKTRGPLLVMVGSGYSGYNNIRLKLLETHLGKPDRTTKEQVKEIIGVAEGVAKPVPLDTRWYGPVGFTFVADSLAAVFYLPEKPDPKPASSPQFDTPLGYYAGVSQITGRKVKSRALVSVTIVADEMVTKHSYGETKAGPNEALVWVRFHTPKAVKNDVHFDQYSAVIDKKSYPVLASTSDLNAEFAEAIRKATTQHGADKSTYLLFAIPDSATKFRLVYADTGIDLAVPVPTVPEEVAPENATPNPTPGRDGVGVSLFDRTTGKVGDIPLAINQKLLEFSQTLDLSRAANREKLIQKWHELAGDKADRYTVTIWAAEKQYRWPHAGK